MNYQPKKRLNMLKVNQILLLFLGPLIGNAQVDGLYTDPNYYGDTTFKDTSRNIEYIIDAIDTANWSGTIKWERRNNEGFTTESGELYFTQKFFCGGGLQGGVHRYHLDRRSLTYMGLESKGLLELLSLGDPYEEMYYTTLNRKLDGIQYIRGINRSWLLVPKDERPNWDFNIRKIAIAGNLIAADEENILPFKFQYQYWISTSLGRRYPPIGYRVKVQREDLYYDLESMVKIFLDDYENHLIAFGRAEEIAQEDDSKFEEFYLNIFLPLLNQLEEIKISAIFEPLEDGVIATSYGIYDDMNIIIKVDPDQWLNTDLCNKWYFLYHELGHDVLNFRHGEGGRMMFNYPTKSYTWEEFFEDRNHMFMKALLKKHPSYIGGTYIVE